MRVILTTATATLAEWDVSDYMVLPAVGILGEVPTIRPHVPETPLRGDTLECDKRVYVVVARHWDNPGTLRLVLSEVPSKSPDAADLRAALEDTP